MIRLFALIVLALVLAEPMAPASTPVHAQSNDNDYTPLNSRIRRDRQFPTEPRTRIDPSRLSDVARRRSSNMVDHFASCLWDRSNEDALDLLERTDFGFRSFEQIGISNNEIGEYYPIRTCLSRVASRNNSAVQLRYDAESMRRWYLREAYMDRYKDGPSWIQPGFVIGDRDYPLSANNASVHSAMDFADCVIAQDPHAVDYFYRTGEGSDEESEAIGNVVSALEPCVPAGQQMELTPYALRVWLGEGLWHAANNSAPPPADEVQEP